MHDRRVRGRVLRLLSWIGLVAALLCITRPASAYPWMIRHGYQGCVPCHADPSGSGLLTEYGRAMGENVLRMRYGSPPPDEPSKVARFLFGVPTPDWLLLGGSVRNGVQLQKSLDEGTSWKNRFLQMQADLRAQVTFSRFRASGTLGYMWEAALPANITSRTEHNLSSREHWVGVDLGEDKQFLLRAGRLNIPFGIRTNEHEMLTRSSRVTRTNVNESQQHGIALSYSGQSVRGEVMAILGNYQLNPDKYRERGYAGFVEFAPKEKLSVGVSSMVTYAKEDLQLGMSNMIRQVHGAFLRASPVTPLVLMAEADAVLFTSGSTTSAGFVSTVQADVEPIQGLHFLATGETWLQSDLIPGQLSKSFSGWATALWFFAPHADLRFDFVAYSVMDQKVSVYLLPQLHLYL
ncbi:Hypothetical protein A7982_09792 [Minicystis rosea]|nr:Hypothetical protein A7982_09792 [Minicystis rosea]